MKRNQQRRRCQHKVVEHRHRYRNISSLSEPAQDRKAPTRRSNRETILLKFLLKSPPNLFSFIFSDVISHDDLSTNSQNKTNTFRGRKRIWLAADFFRQNVKLISTSLKVFSKASRINKIHLWSTQCNPIKLKRFFLISFDQLNTWWSWRRNFALFDIILADYIFEEEKLFSYKLKTQKMMKRKVLLLQSKWIKGFLSNFLMQDKQSKRASHLLILLNLHEATILSVNA